MKISKMIAVLVIALFMGSCIVGIGNVSGSEALIIDGDKVILHGSGDHFVHIHIPNSYGYSTVILEGESEKGSHSLWDAMTMRQLKGTATVIFSPKTHKEFHVPFGKVIYLMVGGHSSNTVTKMWAHSPRGGTMLTSKPTQKIIPKPKPETKIIPKPIPKPESVVGTATGTAKIRMINEHHQEVDAILYIDGKYKDVVYVPPDAWEYHHGNYELSEGTHTFKISWIDPSDYEVREHEISGYIRVRKTAPITLTVEKVLVLPIIEEEITVEPVTENLRIDECLTEEDVRKALASEYSVHITILDLPTEIVVPCGEVVNPKITIGCSEDRGKTSFDVVTYAIIDNADVARVGSSREKTEISKFTLESEQEYGLLLPVKGMKEGTTKLTLELKDEWERIVFTGDIPVIVTSKLTEKELAVRQKQWDDQTAKNEEQTANKEDIGILGEIGRKFAEILSWLTGGIP